MIGTASGLRTAAASTCRDYGAIEPTTASFGRYRHELLSDSSCSALKRILEARAHCGDAQPFRSTVAPIGGPVGSCPISNRTVLPSTTGLIQASAFLLPKPQARAAWLRRMPGLDTSRFVPDPDHVHFRTIRQRRLGYNPDTTSASYHPFPPTNILSKPSAPSQRVRISASGCRRLPANFGRISINAR